MSNDDKFKKNIERWKAALNLNEGWSTAAFFPRRDFKVIKLIVNCLYSWQIFEVESRTSGSSSVLQIAKTCFKDFPRQTFIFFPSAPLFVFIYLLHFLSESTLDMCEWYWKRVWNQTDCFFCFPIPFHRSSHSLFHMNINILPLFRSRVPFSRSGGNSQVEYKNYLSYAHFLSSSMGKRAHCHNKVIFFFSGKHRAMCVEILHAQENYEER